MEQLTWNFKESYRKLKSYSNQIVIYQNRKACCWFSETRNDLEKRHSHMHCSIKLKPRAEQDKAEFYDGEKFDEEASENRSRIHCGCFVKFKCRRLISKLKVNVRYHVLRKL